MRAPSVVSRRHIPATAVNTNSHLVGRRHTGEEDGEEEDEPDARALDGLDAGDAEDGNLRGCVEAKTEDETERVHLPGAVDGLEEAAEDSGEDAAAFEGELTGGVALSLVVIRGAPPCTLLHRGVVALLASEGGAEALD